MFENIPQELKFDGLWCGWKKINGTKMPFNVQTGGMAKSNDRSTFCSFKTFLNKAHEYIKHDENGKWLGGAGLGIFNGFSAVDIDHCVDENGVISDMAQEIINYCQSYTEYSPSHTGIRIIFKTNFKGFNKKIYYTNNHNNHLEIYLEGFTNKFVTITGDVIQAFGVENVDIEYILNKFMRKTKTTMRTNVPQHTENKIEQFLERDAKLKELWNSTASGSGGNESETDMALCNKLAFYLQKDAEAMNEAFINSPYFATKDEKHRAKWLDRDDYRENTIQLAIDSVPEIYKPKKNLIYGYTDTGNAHRFVEQYRDEIRFNIDNNRWMMWNGTNWQFDVFGRIKILAEVLTEQMKMDAFVITDLQKQKIALKNVDRMLSSGGKEAMLREAQHAVGIPITNDQLDDDDWLLNVKNGILDLKTGKLYKHDRNKLLNKIIGTEIKKEKPIKFLKFLNEICSGNQEIIDYLQKAFGYAMTGSTREQKIFFFVGDGSNGKSLLLQIIADVLDEYSATSRVELLLDKKIQGANLSEVARLKGKRFVIVGESESGDKLKESAVKSLVAGNDKIIAKFLYANEFEFYPKMKIFMSTNYDPIIRGTDNGIWRRVVKVPFLRSFSEEEQNKNLRDELEEEKSGILNWLLEGCLKWQKEGLVEPDILKEEKQKYRTDMDIIQKWIEDECDINSACWEFASDLYTSYKEYAVKNNEYLMTQTSFGRNLGKKLRKEKGRNGWMYQGIRLKKHNI